MAATNHQFMTIQIDHIPSRTIYLDETAHLFFSGTSYLGMGHQPAFRAALSEGLAQYGTIFSASRNNNLQLKIYEEAETFLARWTGAAAALTVTSGLLAGQLAVQSIDYQNFVNAPSVHPAIWEPRVPPPYHFQNWAEFAREIPNIATHTEGSLLIACNALDPLRCEQYDYSWIDNLPTDKPITLLIDDSHGLGITGKNGAGIFQSIQNRIQNIDFPLSQYPNLPNISAYPNIRLVVIASLAKALGIPGGVILSDAKTIASIRNNPLFVGASPIVPAYLSAFMAAQSVYKEARKNLSRNIEYFNATLDKALSQHSQTRISLYPFKSLPNYPVFYTELNELAAYLQQQKIVISHFAYPKPQDPPITRVVLSALHTEGDIETLVKHITEFE
jgi:7-keto-8-aminopelargonate synthetase-like enzyme